MVARTYNEEDADPYRDTTPTVARFDGVCCYCKKKTKAGKSLHFFRTTRDGVAGWRESKNAHRDCQDSGGKHLTTRGAR